LRQPRWLITDEATSALDAATELSLQDALQRMIETRHGAWIAIDHHATADETRFNRRWTLQTNHLEETDARAASS
jgi:ABC-type multidrug transport system fused ATPase/permease subunit